MYMYITNSYICRPEPFGHLKQLKKGSYVGQDKFCKRRSKQATGADGSTSTLLCNYVIRCLKSQVLSGSCVYDSTECSRTAYVE